MAQHCVFDGNGGGSHSAGISATRVRGVRSKKAASTEAPLTPSRTAWCTLAISAVRSPSSPSTTCISHSGRSGSSGRLMTPATNASSSACAAGRGQAGPAEVVVELEVRIVDPDRVVEAERNPQGPLAQRRDQVNALLDRAPDLRVARRGREQRTGALGRVEHQRPPPRAWGGGRLEREEGGVHADEGLHHPFLSASLTAVTCRCVRSRLDPAPTRPAASADHALEVGLLDPHQHQLGDAVPPADLVVVLGVMVHQDDLELAAVARVDEAGRVETGDPVPDRQPAPGQHKAGEAVGDGDRPPRWGRPHDPRRLGRTTSLPGHEVGAGVALACVARHREFGIELMQGDAQHRRTIQGVHRAPSGDGR